GYARTAGIPLSQVMSSEVVLLAVWAVARVVEPSAANPPRTASFAKNSRRGETAIAALLPALSGFQRDYSWHPMAGGQASSPLRTSSANLKEAGGATPGPSV